MTSVKNAGSARGARTRTAARLERAASVGVVGLQLNMAVSLASPVEVERDLARLAGDVRDLEAADQVETSDDVGRRGADAGSRLGDHDPAGVKAIVVPGSSP